MAHNLDQSRNGKTAFIAYQQPGWHNLGEVFKTELTAGEALQRASLDFTVLKLPNIHILPDTDRTEIVSENSFFTVRTDVNKILGDKLGSKYEVMQNAEAFNIVDEILQKGTARIETAGAIDEGRKVFICLKIDKDIVVGNDDRIKQYLLISTSHDGTMSITATETPIRVVCNNTLTAALNGAKDAIKIRHTASATDRLREAMKVLKMLDNNADILTEEFNKMQNLEISKAEMFNYFGTIICSPEEIKEFQAGKNMKDVLSTQKQNILSKINYLSTKGLGATDTYRNGNPTMWTAYNAVTEYITSKTYSSINDRADSLLFGSAAQTIKEAGILAAEPAKIQTLARIITPGSFGLN